jgi:NAD(P)-dependent dehydrogenase (short-subunit alcohol dehydrogenase family)
VPYAPGPMPAVLRAGLLDGRVLAFTGAAGPVAAACAALGARTPALAADLLDEVATTAAAAALGPVDALVCDTGPPFAAAGGGVHGLRVALDGAWCATRAVARAKVVLVAPRPREGAHARALGAALESLARTLSVEWARHGVLSTAVLPADATTDDEVGLLVAFLASPAGDYATGCAFTLGGHVR